MSKIRTQKVVFFFFPPKLINIILLFQLLFYYFNYYFIIFLRRPILDLKIPLMSHMRICLWRILVRSYRNTSSCDYNNIELSWFDRNHLNIWIGVWIRILRWVVVNNSSSLPFRNEFQTRFYSVIKCFTICISFCRTLTISGKMSWIPTLITSDFASSSTKSSSLLLSSTSKISTPPLLPL